MCGRTKGPVREWGQILQGLMGRGRTLALTLRPEPWEISEQRRDGGCLRC